MEVTIRGQGAQRGLAERDRRGKAGEGLLRDKIYLNLWLRGSVKKSKAPKAPE